MDGDGAFVARHLARRVRSTGRKGSAVRFHEESVPDGMLDYLRQHLSAGETHYTTRPGMVELRRAIGTALKRSGGPDYEADGVVVTSGEGEGLFVTLLGLGMGAQSKVIADKDCRHRAIFDLLEIDLVRPGDSPLPGKVAVYRELGSWGPGQDGSRRTSVGDAEKILAVGGAVFARGTGEPDLSDFSEGTIVIGNLDLLPGIDHFRVGFVAGPPPVVKGIMTWKQALSICSAAPSQRAALFALAHAVGS